MPAKKEQPKKKSKQPKPKNKTEAEKDQLNYKQELFCYKFVEFEFHGTKAAIAAGYSKTTGYAQANRLRKMPKIKKRIAQIIADALGDTKEELAYRVVRRLEQLAFVNLTEDVKIITKSYLEPVNNSNGEDTGKFKEIPYQVVEAKDTKDFKYPLSVKGIRQHKNGSIEVMQHDPKPYLEMLGRYSGILTDTLKLEGSVDSVVTYLPENNRNDT